MLEFVGLVAWPLALSASTGGVAFAATKAFERYLEHREKDFVHKPLVEMQRKLDELEGKILSAALRGR